MMHGPYESLDWEGRPTLGPQCKCQRSSETSPDVDAAARCPGEGLTFISSGLSSKLKASRLAFCRSGLLDLGRQMKPCCRLHLIRTCALVRPSPLATAVTVLSSMTSRWPLPSGEYACTHRPAFRPSHALPGLPEDRKARPKLRRWHPRKLCDLQILATRITPPSAIASH